MELPLSTRFAPPGRADDSRVHAEGEVALASPLAAALLDAFPEPVVILNRERQIVAANAALAAFLGVPKETVLGKRPGEALGCVHSTDEAAGCGTSEFCSQCGAVRAILMTQASAEPAAEECRILRHGPGGVEALDLKVWTTPLHAGGRIFTVFALRDDTNEKRRHVLEEIFFHDVLNTAGSLSGLLTVRSLVEGREAEELESRVRQLAGQVVREIESQRDLGMAEAGELVVHPESVNVASLVDEVALAYENHSVAALRKIAVAEPSGPEDAVTEPTLLKRVVGNLIKNALEATPPGGTVRVAYRNAGAPEITVQNDIVMPEEVRLQIFQRSFSTKAGHGRGIGTWSVKLLTERYLGGSVVFSSAEGTGTTFTVRLPA